MFNRSKLNEFVGFVATYDTVPLFCVLPLRQMFQVMPPMVTLEATTDPAGWMLPMWLIQTISSNPVELLLVEELGLNQMSYAISQLPFGDGVTFQVVGELVIEL